MNERYLFRGKRLDNGEWVVGCYLLLDDGNYIVAVIKNDSLIFKIDPATIGQCTGLRDKNGTLPYEGDIIHDNESVGIIKYSKGAFVVEWIINKDFYNDSLHVRYENIEIIGNVHDNLELVVGAGTEE